MHKIELFEWAYFSKPTASHSGRSHSWGRKILRYSLAISLGFFSSGLLPSMQLKSWPHAGHCSFCATPQPGLSDLVPPRPPHKARVQLAFAGKGMRAQTAYAATADRRCVPMLSVMQLALTIMPAQFVRIQFEAA